MPKPLSPLQSHQPLAVQSPTHLHNVYEVCCMLQIDIRERRSEQRASHIEHASLNPVLYGCLTGKLPRALSTGRTRSNWGHRVLKVHLDNDLAAVWLQQARHEPQRRRLAGSRATCTQHTPLVPPADIVLPPAGDPVCRSVCANTKDAYAVASHRRLSLPKYWHEPSTDSHTVGHVRHMTNLGRPLPQNQDTLNVAHTMKATSHHGLKSSSIEPGPKLPDLTRKSVCPHLAREQGGPVMKVNVALLCF